MVTLILAIGAGIALAKTGRKAWLGVYTEEVDRDIAKSFKLSSNQGAIVNEVIDDSPADEAGITEDDVIIAVGDTKVTDDDNLEDIILDHRPGDKVTVTLIRDGKEQKVDVTLGRRTASSSSSWSWLGNLRERSKNSQARKHYSSQKNKFFNSYSWADERPYIGVVMYELNEQLAEFFAAKHGGVLITEIVEDSPAEEAGLKAGDVIVGINGEQIEYTEDVSDVVHDMNEGDVAKIDILRDRKPMQIDVTLALRDDGMYGSLDPIIINIPDIPNINIRTPHLRGMNYSIGQHGFTIDSDEYEDMMDDLRDELKDLQEELEDLREELH